MAWVERFESGGVKSLTFNQSGAIFNQAFYTFNGQYVNPFGARTEPSNSWNTRTEPSDIWTTR
jgi:hypothetical protein